MPHRERVVDKGRALALFEAVHSVQLADAYRMLRPMSRYGQWRIALRERLAPPIVDPGLTEDEMKRGFSIIVVRLDRSREKLELADEGSVQALDDWERRNCRLMPREFEWFPDLSSSGDIPCPSQASS